MPTTSLMPEPRQRYYNNNGTVAAGCLLYTYAAGTSTPKAAYTDSAGTTPHANPIVLDAKGEALIYWSGSYKIDLKTAAGVQITGYPVDNFESVDSKIATSTATAAAATALLRADLAASTGAELVGVIAAGASSIARTVQAKGRDILHAKDAVAADGVTNDIAKLQAKCDEIVAGGIKQTLRVSGVMKLNSMLTINATFVQIQGDNAVFDFSSLASGTAVKITGRATGTAYAQSSGGLNGVELIGPGIATTTVGIEFDTAAEAGTSHTDYFNVNVHGFGKGHVFKNNAYVQNFWGCDVWDCATAIEMPTGFANYGERITYFGCTIFNNSFGVVNNNANGAFHLIGSSLDYNGVQAVAQAGRIFLDNCHIEATNYASEPFVTYPVNGATIIINGGWMLCTGSNTSVIFLSQTTARQGGGITVKDMFINAMGTGRWKSGVGRFSLTNITSFNTSNNPKLSSATENRLTDGGFEGATVLDAIITADSAAITSRTVGTNINLTTSVTYARTGARSLKVAKTFGGGSACQFMLIVPLSRMGSLCHSLGYYKKPGAGTGNVFISTGYTSLQINAGVELPVQSVITGTETVTFTAAAVDWTATQSGEPSTSAPSWATHFFVAVNMDSFVGPDSIYFDDFEFYEY